jgi:hypothetical protein
MSVPIVASTKKEFEEVFAEDCHCCSQRAIVLHFALVEHVAGRLGSFSGTHCLDQESRAEARGA